MAITVAKARCPQNHACPLVQHCPAGAISQEGFQAPVLDAERCIDCRECVMICPKDVFEEA